MSTLIFRGNIKHFKKITTTYCLSHHQFESKFSYSATKIIFSRQIDFYTRYVDIQAIIYLLSAISTSVQVIKLVILVLTTDCLFLTVS
jgi:hypothetical protein